MIVESETNAVKHSRAVLHRRWLSAISLVAVRAVRVRIDVVLNVDTPPRSRRVARFAGDDDWQLQQRLIDVFPTREKIVFDRRQIDGLYGIGRRGVFRILLVV